jgi:mannose-6-phosphate isomerase-like protein (cupin superfamily)
VQYCLQSEGTNGPKTPLFDCAEFEQRLLRFDGASPQRENADEDEVLYTLRGSGTVTIGDESATFEEGVAAYIAGGTPWRVDDANGLELLSVLVRDPLPADASHAVLRGGVRAGATAGRQFTLLAIPETGCASVTQFVGYIPPGRAPDHYHLYDEVVYVLEGDGELHIGDEDAPLRPGSCVHLPARLVHCLENTGPGEMRVLGVFRPAGSPAEAYYPDGTLATVPGAN